MTPDALPVTRRGVTRWEEPTKRTEGIAAWAVSPQNLGALDRFDVTDPILAALAVLDAKLGAIIADQERLVRVLGRVADAVDVRIGVE